MSCCRRFLVCDGVHVLLMFQGLQKCINLLLGAAALHCGLTQRPVLCYCRLQLLCMFTRSVTAAEPLRRILSNFVDFGRHAAWLQSMRSQKYIQGTQNTEYLLMNETRQGALQLSHILTHNSHTNVL